MLSNLSYPIDMSGHTYLLGWDRKTPEISVLLFYGIAGLICLHNRAIPVVLICMIHTVI